MRVYFWRDEELFPVERRVTGKDVVQEMVRELLQGPTEGEENEGIYTEIPRGVSALNVSKTQSLVTVDLSPEFERGGGSRSMMGRVAQLVMTLTEVDDITHVRVVLGGKQVEALGGEGLVVAEPLTREDVLRDLL